MKIRKNKRFSDETIINIIWSVARGLKALHSKKIYHLNIKPSNILVFKMGKDDAFKLTDCLGFQYKRSFLASQATYLFESPERLM